MIIVKLSISTEQDQNPKLIQVNMGLKQLPDILTWARPFWLKQILAADTDQVTQPQQQ